MKYGKLVKRLIKSSKLKLGYPEVFNERTMSIMEYRTRDHILIKKKYSAMLSKFKDPIFTYEAMVKFQKIKGLIPNDRFAALESWYWLDISYIVKTVLLTTRNKNARKELGKILDELIIKDILE